MAELCSMMLQNNNINVDQMINFGAPRVGDTAFAAFTDKKFHNSWRMVHNKDSVPHIPPQGPPTHYYHTSTEEFENSSGKIKTCKNGEDSTCSNQYKTYNVDDHYYYL